MSDGMMSAGIHDCVYCQKKYLANPLRCSKCKRECQLNHWKTHAPECKKATEFDWPLEDLNSDKEKDEMQKVLLDLVQKFTLAANKRFEVLEQNSQSNARNEDLQKCVDESYKDLKKCVDGSNTRIDELEKQLSESKKQIAMLEKLTEEKGKQVGVLEKSVDASKKQINLLEKRVKESDKRADKMEKQIQDSKRQWERVKDYLTEVHKVGSTCLLFAKVNQTT